MSQKMVLVTSGSSRWSKRDASSLIGQSRRLLATWEMFWKRNDLITWNMSNINCLPPFLYFRKVGSPISLPNADAIFLQVNKLWISSVVLISKPPGMSWLWHLHLEIFWQSYSVFAPHWSPLVKKPISDNNLSNPTTNQPANQSRPQHTTLLMVTISNGHSVFQLWC